MIPIQGSKLFIEFDDVNFKKINQLYGETHTIEAVIGTTPMLSKLQSNQSVVYGDGKTYHFRLTKKS